jgi:hypothetical protein
MKPYIALFAIDAGARHVMSMLSQDKNTCFLGNQFNEEILRTQKIPELLLNQFEIWTVGTSGSIEGQILESVVRKNAVLYGKKLVVIEDFPGNFKPIGNGQPDLLIVDHESVRVHHEQRLKEECPEIKAIPNPRYDVPRTQYKGYQDSKQRADNSNKVLWAGQPEFEDALIVLSRLIPTLKECRLELLFSAHPRDKGYPSEYSELFKRLNVEWIDVNEMSLGQCKTQYNPRAIITQYSSVAIDAGFYGIPSVNVLYDDVGAKRLMADKFYTIPPWCLLGASMLIQSKKEQSCIIKNLVNSVESRFRQAKNFEEFWSLTPSLSTVLAHIKEI